jgi:AcrR family transcriptional regulator
VTVQQTTRAEEAMRLTARRLLDGRPLRMGELATELGVSRVSLHRWVGSREELLGETLSMLAERNIADAIRTTRSRARGGARIAAIVGRYLRTVNTTAGLRAFIEREPELAMRILTTKASPVQARSVAAVEALLRETAAAGELDPPMDVHDLAYVIVRIGESFLYANLITGEPPDDEKARQAIAALLR